MELTYEQHVELLKLANYLAKVKISHSKKDIELDSLVNQYRNGNTAYDSQRTSQKTTKPTMFLEKNFA